MRNTAAIGLDIGGTRIKAVVAENDGTILDQVIRTPDFDVPESWKTNAVALVRELTDQYGVELEIGVCTPGLVAQDGRSIWNLPNRMPGLEGLDWQQCFGWARPVPVMNDGQAALLGECWLGRAASHQNVVLLTLGTGIGGAAMVDGHVLRGAFGRAGHFGHISISDSLQLDIVRTPGSFEDAVGNHTVRQRSHRRFGDTREMLTAAQAGDKAAMVTWEQMMKDLARGVVSLINTLDPELVLLAGGITSAGDALMTSLQSKLEQWEWRPGGVGVTLAIADLAEWAGAFGAAAAAMGISPSKN